ncbi:hypothetical protein IQ249_02820 [Lusitaniella coriacea LEGE 07157]|uniref:Sulfotransferase n=1 Tax=Lusitaniella coriacea LEGE 07157 TaxID=945747 RepID=A0A8J7ARL0_9CYAN|nr:hypothetical protein [Lusitaniella coriacea]MBE9114821.1 hypothetical protein [Lusitaniella coriacea LEGE 07157]
MPSNLIDALRRTKRDLIYSFEDTVRIIEQNFLSSKSEIINQKAIRIVGLKRSGNHAIINWIRKQEGGNVWYLNNLRPQQNPYRYLDEHYPREKWEKEAKGNLTKKDCLIYSYENCELSKIIDSDFEEKHELYLGKSAERYDVLILRDPFNMLASMLHNHKKQIQQQGQITKNYFQGKNRYGRDKKGGEELISLWIDYAKEFLGETNFLNHNKVVISYNSWFSSEDYRKELSQKLKLNFSDRGKNEVKDFGGGSSFEGLKLDGTAVTMDVLNRWKTLIDNPQYRALLDNRELVQYSEKIFGHIPDTEKLRES